MRESINWPGSSSGRAKAMLRSLNDPKQAGRVTSRIGFTRRNGVRVVRSWTKKGEMIQTEYGQTSS